jgi:hypothetical protein
MSRAIFVLIVLAGVVVAFLLRRRDDFHAQLGYLFIAAIISTFIAALGTPHLTAILMSLQSRPEGSGVPNLAPSELVQSGDDSSAREDDSMASMETESSTLHSVSAGQGGANMGLRFRLPSSWSSADRLSLQSAITARITATGWKSRPRPGGYILTASGVIRELPLTLGQIPTVSVTLVWKVQDSSNNQVLAEGGIHDLRDTGVDPESARNSALGRASNRIVAALAQANAGIN